MHLVQAVRAAGMLQWTLPPGMQTGQTMSHEAGALTPDTQEGIVLFKAVLASAFILWDKHISKRMCICVCEQGGSTIRQV